MTMNALSTNRATLSEPLLCDLAAASDIARLERMIASLERNIAATQDSKFDLLAVRLTFNLCVVLMAFTTVCCWILESR